LIFEAIFLLNKNSTNGINDKRQSRKTIDTAVLYGVDRGSKTTGRAGSAGASASSFNGPRHWIPPAGYSVSKPSRANPKALPHIGATDALSALRVPAGKIRE
jgi:hypothetical protein